MSDIQAHGATRRGVLKTGALGLGGMAGAIGLSGVSASATQASPALMSAVAGAGNYFLRIDGIPGDSQVDQYVGWIELGNYQSSAAGAPSTSGGSGSTSGKPTISHSWPDIMLLAPWRHGSAGKKPWRLKIARPAGEAR